MTCNEFWVTIQRPMKPSTTEPNRPDGDTGESRRASEMSSNRFFHSGKLRVVLFFGIVNHVERAAKKEEWTDVDYGLLHVLVSSLEGKGLDVGESAVGGLFSGRPV